ncbi:unnamed protein product [Ostreobium quekettii]|uniref:UBC core domain-containing protein n=1 Tax=Ostreobium quekettii TaxID=121088 RepID=A0A8S1JAL5_9CHLO|nr:unnamed protein product [Ostreobium quekettii]
MEDDNSPDFVAQALEDDIFEWHFVIRGPPDTAFEGGMYHGRILLPPDYPFKPPSFIMLSKNGRFETGIKICLSISSHHPEHWQPSWGVRTALTALVAFMPTPGKGALGSLDFPAADRKDLARLSRTTIPKFGPPARQRVAEEAHEKALERFKLPSQGGSLPGGLDPKTVSQPTVAKGAGTKSCPPDRRENCDLPPAEARQPADRRRLEADNADWGLSVLSWALLFMIFALVAKKALTRAGFDVMSFLE